MIEEARDHKWRRENESKDQVFVLEKKKKKKKGNKVPKKKKKWEDEREEEIMKIFMGNYNALIIIIIFFDYLIIHGYLFLYYFGPTKNVTRIFSISSNWLLYLNEKERSCWVCGVIK
jgi:hypothetical protein